MEPGSSTQQHLQNKKKRRPRSAAGERNYLCGCGKAYLSYPALYTHVKNKHNGIFPIGSNAKRKIPRNMEENDDSFIIDVKRLMEEFEKFLGSLPEASQKENVENMSEASDEYLENIINSNFPEFERDAKPLLNSLKWAKSVSNNNALMNNQVEELNLYQVFAVYLSSIYKYCSKSFFREYTLLFAMLVKALNEKGEMFLDKEEKKIEPLDENMTQFCYSPKVHISAEILNLFIAELFPKYLRELDK